MDAAAPAPVAGATSGAKKRAAPAKSAKAAKQKVLDADREERRRAKPASEIVPERWALDKAAVEVQRPGAHETPSLWEGKDGFAMRGKLEYNSDALRTLLERKGLPRGTRPLPFLRNAVEKAYGIS